MAQHNVFVHRTNDEILFKTKQTSNTNILPICVYCQYILDYWKAWWKSDYCFLSRFPYIAGKCTRLQALLNESS